VVFEVSEQVDRASEIINRLRDFSRKPHFEKEPLDINRPIKRVLKILNQQLHLLDINIETDLCENLPVILAQNNPLEQVFFNLITNARDAIVQKGSANPRDRIITVRTFCENHNVVAAVEDTGMGIPDEVKERILEPFFTTKEVGKGMGLGLYITYGIIKDYGGEIEIHSRESEGATIKVMFPSQDQGVE
jgi:C4-dicarboxylate-specific signal transduction histidine kinase